MSYLAIIEYLQSMSKIYLIADKNKKSQLLDDANKITGHHRKSLIRLINKKNQIINNKKNNCGAKVKYPEELLLPHIKFLWISMERITAKRMKAAYSDWLPLYHENDVDNHVKFLLQRMSASTLSRFVKKIKIYDKNSLKGLSSTCPARHMKNKVPINTLDSIIKDPGHIQADTVAHCGDTLVGSFINSITLTDIASTWTENRALFTKKGKEVKEAILDIKRSLPFDIKAINTDSGSEFLNMPVFNMLHEKNIKFTRSRPYKKNDNCYVEQKNFTHTRELFGYQRFEDKDLVVLMNDIYKNYWNPLQNYFLPTFKLKEKIRIGARIKKTYDDPLTPYQRLMNSNAVTNVKKTQLTAIKKSLNPFELKKGLEEKLLNFFNKVNEYNRIKGISK